MIRFWLKQCPRCQGGDLFRDQDRTITCLQCGYEEYRMAGLVETPTQNRLIEWEGLHVA